MSNEPDHETDSRAAKGPAEKVVPGKKKAEKEAKSAAAGPAAGQPVLSQPEEAEEEDPWAEDLAAQRVRDAAAAEAVPGQNRAAQNTAGASASKTGAAPESDGSDLLLDVELEATLRFGSREMTLGEVLDLGPGDVIELDRQVNDAVELLVGDKIVARGMAVLCNGKYGLRVTEVAELKLTLESVRCLF